MKNVQRVTRWPVPALALALGTLALGTTTAQAKMSATDIEKLGKTHTCFGAEKAGTSNGVAEYTGKWIGVPDTVKFNPKSGVYPDPYKDEKPIAVITSANLAEHKTFLSPGQLALFKKYPATYKIMVYPSHRDFGYEPWRCERTMENAKNATLKSGGMGVNGTRGGVLFPIPSSGDELFWNITTPHRVMEEEAIYDNNVVFPNGRRTEGRVYYRIYSPNNDPKLPKKMDKVAAANVKVLLPEREKGNIFVSVDSEDFKTTPRVAWQYNAGTRRVRQMPTFGFDMPSPSAGGTATIDDDRLFNGSPERYDWTLVGKKELYIPYNSYRTDSPDVNYKTLYPAKHHNPEHWRYELHRVYVLEATLKKGYRHLYAKRRFYVDEDSNIIVQAENYDARGNLWRVGIVSPQYIYDAKAFEVRNFINYDLNSGAYLVDRLVNEQKDRPLYNRSKFKPNVFTPGGLRSQGR